MKSPVARTKSLPTPTVAWARARRRDGRTLAVVITLTSTFGFAGCAAPPLEETQPTTCAEIVKQAVYEREVEDEVKGFDTAIETCASYDQLKTEMNRYELPGYTVERFIEKRCIDESEVLADTDVCQVAAPPTTLPEVIDDPEYTGQTLDGREITVTPTPDLKFEDGVPAQIKITVEKAKEGCVSVLGVRDDMAQYVTPTPNRSSDIASMFAQHAQSVAAFIGCTIPPVVIGPSGPLPNATPTTAPTE